MNAFIMDQQNAFKLINEFASISRSFAYWSGGAINFFQDEKEKQLCFLRITIFQKKDLAIQALLRQAEQIHVK